MLVPEHLLPTVLVVQVEQSVWSSVCVWLIKWLLTHILRRWFILTVSRLSSKFEVISRNSRSQDENSSSFWREYSRLIEKWKWSWENQLLQHSAGFAYDMKNYVYVWTANIVSSNIWSECLQHIIKPLSWHFESIDDACLQSVCMSSCTIYDTHAVFS